MLNIKGSIEQNIGYTEKAQDCYQRATKLDPNNYPAQRNSLFNLLNIPHIDQTARFQTTKHIVSQSNISISQVTLFNDLVFEPDRALRVAFFPVTSGCM